jgi:hypothetical protein
MEGNSMEEIWYNTHTILFRVYKDRPGYAMPCVSIEEAVWYWPSNVKLILHGLLPSASDLLEISDQVRFDLLYKECGDIEEYREDEVIFHFSDCKIRRKWTPNLIPSLPFGADAVRIYVSLECSYRRGPWKKTKSS